MKRINFSITDVVYLAFDAHSVDLHNSYAFSGFTFDIDKRCFSLHWRQLKEHWVDRKSFDTIEIRFDRISFLAMKPRDPEMPFTEDTCLSFMGYLHPEDLSEMSGFLLEEEADESFHMIFSFQSDASIKVFAEEAMVLATLPPSADTCLEPGS